MTVAPARAFKAMAIMSEIICREWERSCSIRRAMSTRSAGSVVLWNCSARACSARWASRTIFSTTFICSCFNLPSLDSCVATFARTACFADGDAAADDLLGEFGPLGRLPPARGAAGPPPSPPLPPVLSPP